MKIMFIIAEEFNFSAIFLGVIYMIKIDLITGFLGAGKTTFLKKYVSWLNEQGQKIGIIENDFGAINVDALLLQELQSDLCDVEQIVGGNEVTDWKRRFRAKLIAMAMQGFDRIIVEPSGIYEVDAFFDVLYEEPLDRWYEAGTVFAIVNGQLEDNLTEEERYLMVSQVANASRILLSKTEDISEQDIENTKRKLHEMLEEFHCDRKLDNSVMSKEWSMLTDNDFLDFIQAGWIRADHEKLWFDKKEAFDTLFFMNEDYPEDINWKEIIEMLFQTPACGEISRIKGFINLKESDSVNNYTWKTLNATKENYEEKPSNHGQKVMIVIGKNLNKENILKLCE